MHKGPAMHAEIMEYLHRYTPVHLHNLLDDPQVTFEALQLDALCPVELAMLIEDGMDTVIADDTYLSWRCVQDVLDAGEECYAH